jgi:hypothetical protein
MQALCHVAAGQLRQGIHHISPHLRAAGKAFLAAGPHGFPVAFAGIGASCLYIGRNNNSFSLIALGTVQALRSTYHIYDLFTTTAQVDKREIAVAALSGVMLAASLVL